MHQHAMDKEFIDASRKMIVLEPCLERLLDVLFAPGHKVLVLTVHHHARHHQGKRTAAEFVSIIVAKLSHLNTRSYNACTCARLELELGQRFDHVMTLVNEGSQSRMSNKID